MSSLGAIFGSALGQFYQGFVLLILVFGALPTFKWLQAVLELNLRSIIVVEVTF